MIFLLLMRSLPLRLAWLMAEMWCTWEKSAIGWPLERRKAFIYCWLSCLRFCLVLSSCWLQLLFVHSKLSPTILLLRPCTSHKGGVLWTVTIWGFWHSVGHCFLWRQMVIVVSNSDGVHWTARPWLLGLPKCCQFVVVVVVADTAENHEACCWGDSMK